MDATTVLLDIVLVAALVTAGFAVWALRRVGAAADSARLLADEWRREVTPLAGQGRSLLDKADVTVDAFNAELLRVDGVITRFEDAAERVSDTTARVSQVTQVPEKVAAEVGERMRHFFAARRQAAPAAPGTAATDSPEDR